MNIYLISQIENSCYDTYDSAVVVAPNLKYAKNMHPHDGKLIDWTCRLETWCSDVQFVHAVKVGISTKYKKPCVIESSFSAG